MKFLLLAALCFVGANAQVRWVPADNGNVPPGGIQGGAFNGDPLFVCRTLWNGDELAGALSRQPPGACRFGISGVVRSARIYDVAVGSHTWRAFSRGQTVPSTAVMSGFTAQRDQIYVCRARHFANTIPGKLVWGICFIPDGDREHAYNNSEIMLN